jgi:hypothetical protein
LNSYGGGLPAQRHHRARPREAPGGDGRRKGGRQYKYVQDQLADDWWVVLKQEWVDTGQFKT